MSESKKNIQKYKKDLEKFKNLIIEEMESTSNENRILKGWIESEKEKFNLQMKAIEDFEEKASDFLGDINLDIHFIKDKKNKSVTIKDTQFLKDQYEKTIKSKSMLWNKFKNRLFNYAEDISEPRKKEIQELSSFKKVENRFIEFNERSEYLSDIQVELENEIKNINRSIEDFRNFLNNINNFINKLSNYVENPRVSQISSFSIKRMQIKRSPKINRTFSDIEKIRAKLRTRDKIRSRLVREVTPEILELQKIHEVYQKKKEIKEKVGRTIQMKDLYLPLNKKRIPIYDIQTGRISSTITL